MFGATDWALKRVAKFLLKRSLGRVLKSDVDLELLEVALGTGSLAMRRVLLDCDYINELLEPFGFEMTAAYLGLLRVTVPLTALYSESCRIEVDEALFTLRPSQRDIDSSDLCNPRGVDATPIPTPSEAAEFPDFDDLGSGQATVSITGGIQGIAGSLEAVLGRLCVTATRVTVRLELPSSSGPVKTQIPAEVGNLRAVAVLRLAALDFCGDSRSQQPRSSARSGESQGTPSSHPGPGVEDDAFHPKAYKHAQFSGLSVELYEEGEESEDAAGVAAAATADLGGSCLVEKLAAGDSGPDAPALSDGEGTASECGDTAHVIICSPEGIGCSGRLDVELTWGEGAAQPHAGVSLTLQPLQARLKPEHPALLAHLAACISASLAARATPEQDLASACMLEGNRSFLEGFLMPDYEGFVASALTTSGTSWHSAAGGYSWGSGSQSGSAGYGSSGVTSSNYLSPGSGVRSTVGSIRSGLTDLVSSTAETLQNLAGGVDGGSSQPHTPLKWAFRATTSNLSLLLFYPETAQHLPAGQGIKVMDRLEGFGDDCAARLSVECTDLEMKVSGGGSTDCMQILVRLYRLEAAEHLAGTQEEAAELSEAAGVPAVLPQAPGGSRPQPSFYGAVHCPPTSAPPPVAVPGMQPAGNQTHRSFYSSTLSDLSFMSASGTLNRSSMKNSTAWQGVNPPALLVRPVMCCGGAGRSEGGNPSLVLTIQLPVIGSGADHKNTGAGQRAGHLNGAPSSHANAPQLQADVALTPVTVWASFPFLQRLQSYAEAVMPPLSSAEASAAVDDAQRYDVHTRPADTARNAAQEAIDSILCDMERLKEREGGQRNVHNGGATPTVSASIAAPHVCFVMSLPHPVDGSLPGHGYTYLAADLFSPAHGSRQQRQQHPQGRLLSNGTAVEAAEKPLMMLRSGRRHSTGIDWNASFAIQQVKVYVVGSHCRLDPGFSSTGADSGLYASCLLNIDAPSVRTSGEQAVAVTAEACWCPGAQQQALNPDSAWDRVTQAVGAADDAGSARTQQNSRVDDVTFEEAAISASSLVLHLQAPCVRADVCQADLAALWQLATAYLEWQAALALKTVPDASLPPPLQTALTLELGLFCRLQQQAPEEGTGRNAVSAFEIVAEELRVFLIGSLGGCLEASALCLEAKGLNIIGGAEQACLLHCPGGTQGSAALRVLHAQRPLDLTTSAMLEGPLDGATLEALGCVTVRGASLASEGGDPGLPWLLRLISYFQVGTAMEQPPDAPLVDASWTIVLQDVALRYEPAPPAIIGAHSPDPDMLPPPSIAAALLVNTARCQLLHKAPSTNLTLRGLSLFIAEAEGRGSGWEVQSAVDVPSLQLLARGYACVAQESLLGIEVTPTSSDNGTSLVEVINEGLRSSLTLGTYRNLLALGEQLAQLVPAPSPPVDAGNGGATQSHRALGTAAVRVMDQVDEEAFCRRVRSEEMESSVYLDGGWYDGDLQDSPPEVKSPSSNGSANSRRGRAATAHVSNGSNGSRPSNPESGIAEGVSNGWQMGSSAPSQGTLQSLGARRGQRSRLGVDRGGRPRHGVAPDVLENFLSQDSLQRDSGEGGAVEEDFDEADLLEWDDRGRWYAGDSDSAAGGSFPVLVEDHVPPPSEEELAAAREGGGGALRPLPTSYPRSTSRLILRDLNVTVALCRDNSLAPEQARRRRSGGGTEGLGASKRLELELAGVCLQVDLFEPKGQHARRVALSVHHVEARDCDVSRESKNVWRRILGHRTTLRSPRDVSAPMIQVEVDVVRPDPAEPQEELRLLIALLPMHIRLDQLVCHFLAVFFAPPETTVLVAVSGVDGGEDEDSGTTGVSPGGEQYIQRAEIRAWGVTLDYKPRKVDVAALRNGAFVEVLNLVPWSGVEVALRHSCFTGLHGWNALAEALAQAYIHDITANQAHKFVVGVAPIGALCRVGTAAAQLAAIPADQLAARAREGPGRGRRRQQRGGGHQVTSVQRQIQRGMSGLARAIVLEALALSAIVAGGAQAVLQGNSASPVDGVGRHTQPAGVVEGLRQASVGLRSGFTSAAQAVILRPARSLQQEGLASAIGRAVQGVPLAAVAPAEAIAGAVRSIALGVRNDLDPDRFQERGLNRALR